MRLALPVLLATLAFAASPFLVPDFGGFDPEAFAVPQVNPPVQPAGYAFSIWGVIYLWLIASCVFGALKRADDPEWQATRPWLIVSLAVGTFWLGIANASALWATITIWIMLVTALGALLSSPATDRLWLRAPIGLYAGWLSAASFVALSALLAGNGVLTDAFGWALILIPAACLLAMAVQFTARRAPEYGMAVAWALIAIVVVNDGTVAILAGLCAAAIAALALRSTRAAPA